MAKSLKSWISSLVAGFRRAKRCEAKICPAGVFALAHLPCGICVLVRALELSPEAANRLRQMGIREGCRIALLSRSEPMLVSVDNTRIALDPQLCRRIKVESV
jgi:Fe2+ transport system protein FeoA